MGIPRRGIILPLVTPFTAEGDVDEAAFRGNLRYFLETGVHGLIVLATAGEAPTLALDEARRLVDTTVELAAGRKPVLVGVGGLNIKVTEALIRHSEAIGAAGLFVITPYFFKLTPAEYLSYYQRLARSTRLEIMVYNSTYANTPLSLDMIETLLNETNIVALKEGNQLQLGEGVRRFGERLSIFTSRDVYIYETLATGGHGAIAFSANVVPELVLALFAAAEANDHTRARELQFRLNPLVWQLVSRSYPVPLKAAMTLAGRTGGQVRAPLSSLTADELKRLKAVLEKVQEPVVAA